MRKHNGAAFSYLTGFVPGPIGQTFGESDMAVNSLLGLFEKNGVRIGSARQAFSAVLDHEDEPVECNASSTAPIATSAA